jgi:hypothetical protein
LVNVDDAQRIARRDTEISGQPTVARGNCLYRTMQLLRYSVEANGLNRTKNQGHQ